VACPTGGPADFDGDGTVDFFDYDAYGNCFEGIVCRAGKDADFDGEGTADFPLKAYEDYTRSLEALFKKGINPLQVAREAARAQGAEFHVMLRPAGWVGSMPYEETFNHDCPV
ncbi:MAG: hypothetical protein AAB385_00075, partial [Planctomycetota bacterium]